MKDLLVTTFSDLVTTTKNSVTTSMVFAAGATRSSKEPVGTAEEQASHFRDRKQ